MGLTRERISYSLGNENNPGNPFGRDSLVIEIDGRARLDHYGGQIGRAAWTGTVTKDALDSLWSAMERSSFPHFPMQNVPPGASFHTVTVGAGPASSRSASLYIYGTIPPGYDAAITIFSAIVRQMSDPADASPPAALKVADVARVEPDDPRFATPPSPGTAFLLAYLSARRVTQVARRELLDHHGASAAIRQTVEAEQRASERNDSFLWNIVQGLGIAIPPPPRQAEPGDSTTTWLTDIATAVRPRLTSPELESAWHAGEAARLFSVCLGLEATVAELRGAAPDDAELRAQAVELARDRAESFATLKARLEATKQPLVIAQANRLARPDAVASEVPEIFNETARAFDGAAPLPPKPKPPSIDAFLSLTTDRIDFPALEPAVLEQLALQTSDAAIATSALRELSTRTKDANIASRILWAKTWNEQLSAYAFSLVFARDLELGIRHMLRLLMEAGPCGRVLLEEMAASIVTQPDRFTSVSERAIVRMLLVQLGRIDPAELEKPDALEGVRELDRRAKALGR